MTKFGSSFLSILYVCMYGLCACVSLCYRMVWCVLHNPVCVCGKRKVKHGVYSSRDQNKCSHYMWIVSVLSGWFIFLDVMVCYTSIN